MQLVCIICLENFTPDCEVSSTQCGHIFHSNCLRRSLATNQLDTNQPINCPQCRNYIGPNHHRVYLPFESAIKGWTKNEKNLLQIAVEEGSLEWYK